MNNISVDYFNKYIKYKNKYEHLKQNAGSKSMAEQYSEKFDQLMKEIKKQNISIQIVNETIQFFKKFEIKNYDPERMHILEDTLMSKFISDLADKNISDLYVLQEIATLIKKLNDENYLKWYA